MKTRVLCLLLLLSSFLAGFTAPGAPEAAADSAALLSLRRLQARADSGDNDARFRLARTLETGYSNILPPDSAKARRLFELAADSGFAPAQNYMGFLLYGEQKPDSALNWFMRAADAGDLTAYTNIGWMLLHGQGAERDYGKALYWLKRGTDMGSPAAAAMLADMYRHGNGVSPDSLAAINLYDKALALYAKAHYRDAEGIADVSQSLLSLFPPASTLMPDSLMSLTARYMRLRVPVVAMHFAKAAADSGNARAETLLGKAYARGVGVEYDPMVSADYFLRGAAHGEPAAAFILAELIDIYPDLIDELPIAGNLQLQPYMHTAQYWRQLAADAGVDSIEKAEDRMSDYGL